MGMVERYNVNNNDNKSNGRRIYRRGIKQHTTLVFLEDLRKELQQNSEVLSKLFPERLRRYNHTDLSKFWLRSSEYVTRTLYRFKKDPSCKFPQRAIDDLKNILINQYGSIISSICLELIKRYESKKLSLSIFIELLLKEVPKISGQINVIDSELNTLFGYGTGRVTDIVYDITTRGKNFKFSLERLYLLRDNLLALVGERAKKCLELIEKYRVSNPDIRLYSYQQYTIENPTFFHDMKTKDQFYWLGLLCSDGHLRKIRQDYTIQLKLSVNDIDRVEGFAEAVGLPIERIKYIIELKEDNNGNIKPYHYTAARFCCKPMAEQLESLGFLRFKAGKIGLLDIIKIQLRNAKNYKFWGDTQDGKKALSFLLGFYDGDGHLKKSRTASIISNNKKLLYEIKILFGSPNIPRPNKKDQSYQLALGPNLLMAMMLSYSNSMQRKRPKGKYSEKNYPRKKIEDYYSGSIRDTWP